MFAVFKPDELRQALMPTWEKLFRCDPESLPFRQPVDPIQLAIPVPLLFVDASKVLKEKLSHVKKIYIFFIGFYNLHSYDIFSDQCICICE